MEAWETALNKFLGDWRDLDGVVGALACGSYVTGGPTGHSDIDGWAFRFPAKTE